AAARALRLRDRRGELVLRLAEAGGIDVDALRDRLRLALELAGRLLSGRLDLLRVAAVRPRGAAVHDVPDVVDEGVDLALDRVHVAVRGEAVALGLGLREPGGELVVRLAEAGRVDGVALRHRLRVALGAGRGFLPGRLQLRRRALARADGSGDVT